MVPAAKERMWVYLLDVASLLLEQIALNVIAHLGIVVGRCHVMELPQLLHTQSVRQLIGLSRSHPQLEDTAEDTAVPEAARVQCMQSGHSRSQQVLKVGSHLEVQLLQAQAELHGVQGLTLLSMVVLHSRHSSAHLQKQANPHAILSASVVHSSRAGAVMAQSTSAA